MQARAAMREAGRFYWARWPHVVLVAAVIYTAFSFLTALLILQAGSYGLLAAVPLWLTGVFWVQAALAPLVQDVRWGKPPPSLAETFRRATRRANRISVAGILAAVGIYVGFYLLVIPGLVLLVRWSLLVPTIMFEGAGVFTAFARSRDLVRGNAWRVFGFVVGSIVLFFASLVAIGALSAGIGSDQSGLGGWLVLGAISVAVLSLTTPLIALVWTMAYFELRAEHPPHEEVGPPRLRPSRALDEAWMTIKVHPGRLLALGAIVGAPVTAAVVAFDLAGASAWAPLVVAPVLVGYIWLAGLLAAGLPTFREGSARSWLRDLLRRTAPGLVRLVGAGLLAGAVFATGIGLLLLPYWAWIGGTILVENCSLGAAFGHSRRLASGNVRRVVKLLVVSVIVALAASFLFVILFSRTPEWAYALSAAAIVLTAPYVGLAWAHAYGQLRELGKPPEPAPEPPERAEAITR
jgi:hypothetical protein